MAETLLATSSEDERQARGGLNPDVVEAACLAHDLGHPPFGHVAERTLDALLEESPLDGFEGNAQSFRIVTKLSFRKRSEPALNLTRGTLNALLKYPWLKGKQPIGGDPKKWGAYRSERTAFDHARASAGADPSLEARLMDWADDITYAVHDLEDFYRAGLTPLDRLRIDGRETAEFLERRAAYVQTKGYDPQQFRDAFSRTRQLFPPDRYSGSQADRITLHNWASTMIGYFTQPVRISADRLVDDGYLYEVLVLKQITWHFVIDSPALATLHRGQEEIIQSLYKRLFGWAKDSWGQPAEMRRLPMGLRYLLLAAGDDPEAIENAKNESLIIQRAVVDYIAALGEDQAIDLHERLVGGRAIQAIEPWLQV